MYNRVNKSWQLFKVVDATDEFLLRARMEGRLVYIPWQSCKNVSTTRFCSTLRKQKSVAGPRHLMNKGMLFYNRGNYRPCNGKSI